MTSLAAHVCPYCQFPVRAAGVVECKTCGGALREVSSGTWAPLVQYRGAQRIRELELRIERVRGGMTKRHSLLTTTAMPLALLGALEFALARLGSWARAAGHDDAFILVVLAAGLVAFAIYMIVDAAWDRFRQDRGRRRALDRLREQRNLARRRTSEVYMRQCDRELPAAIG